MCFPNQRDEKQLTGWHMTVRFIPKIQSNKKKLPGKYFCRRPCPKTHIATISFKRNRCAYVSIFICQVPMEEIKDGYPSSTSSPPTPPSPLPISVGPGNQKYNFSPSPSPSPPFSPQPSSHTSAENLPLLHERLLSPSVPLAFSLDRQRKPEDLDSRSSCLKDL